MRLGKEHGLSDQNYVWHGRSSNMTCSGSNCQIIMIFSGNHVQVSSKVVLEAQDIARDGSGDPLKDRFSLMMKFDGFYD